MASISANGAKGHHRFTLTLTEGDYSVANNTSPVSFSFTLVTTGGLWNWEDWGQYIAWNVTINGTNYSGYIPNYDGKSTLTLKSGTQTITHNSNGAKSIDFSFSVTDNAGQYYTCGDASAKGSMTLATIPRQATLLTAPNFSDGTNPTITFSNPAGTAATLEVGIFNTAGSQSYVPYRNDVNETATSYTFALTDAEWAILRNATTNSNSISVRFYLRTTINGNYYHSYLERTFSITNANPIITASVIDDNDATYALTGDRNKLIKYYSNAKATMSAEAQKGAAINESLYIIRNGEETGYGTEYTFNNVESNEFTFSAEDSRGNIGTATVKPTMVDYVKLTCYISNNKPDADGDMLVSCTGNYFNGSFGAVENTLTVQYRYKVSGGYYGSWTNMTVTKSGNTYYASASLSGLDYQTAYVFQTRAIDKLDTVPSSEPTVRSIPVYHWGENDFVFEVPVTFNAGKSDPSEGDLLDRFFPVGTIIHRYDHISPASLFGGVWTRVLHNSGGATFLYGCTSSGSIGECGGESTHILTVSEMPSHSHSLAYSPDNSGSSTTYKYGIAQNCATNSSNGKGWSNNLGTFTTGSGQAHNNMPPYIKVSIWRRTA